MGCSEIVSVHFTLFWVTHLQSFASFFFITITLLLANLYLVCSNCQVCDLDVWRGYWFKHSLGVCKLPMECRSLGLAIKLDYLPRSDLVGSICVCVCTDFHLHAWCISTTHTWQTHNIYCVWKRGSSCGLGLVSVANHICYTCPAVFSHSTVWGGRLPNVCGLVSLWCFAAGQPQRSLVWLHCVGQVD